MQNMLWVLFVSTKLCVLFGPVFIMIIETSLNNFPLRQKNRTKTPCKNCHFVQSRYFWIGKIFNSKTEPLVE